MFELRHHVPWWRLGRKRQLAAEDHQLQLTQARLKALIQQYPNVHELYLRSKAISPDIRHQYMMLQQIIQDAQQRLQDPTLQGADHAFERQRQQLRLETAHQKIKDLRSSYPGLVLQEMTTESATTLLDQARGV